ncbi:MAG: type III secretion system translocon subunit SctB [Victivallales bacterium]|nr:type III secretion system translocon subunit SctB [Victivallales bacterium]
MVEGIGNHRIIPGGSGTPPKDIRGGTGVGGAKETTEAQETKGAGLLGQLKTETVGKKEGVTGSTAPQLTAPAGNYKATETANNILNTLGKLDSADMGKGLFVLLQILQLLQKAMNEMQQSMQVMRQAETNLAIANIEAEAENMESAATFGLWMGVISSVVQIGASAGSMISGFKGVTNTMKAKATGEQLKTAQTEMTTLKENMGTFKTEMRNLNTEMGTLKNDMAALKTELATLQGAEAPNQELIAAKQQQITNKQTDINAKQQQIDGKQQQIDEKQAEIDMKQMEMMGLKAKMDMQLSTAQSQANKGQGISQFVGSFAGLAKAIGDGITGGMQADAKRIEAQLKQVEASAEQTGKITQSVKDMLSTLLNLMKSVSQTESEATAQILRGI